MPRKAFFTAFPAVFFISRSSGMLELGATSYPVKWPGDRNLKPRFPCPRLYRRPDVAVNGAVFCENFPLAVII